MNRLGEAIGVDATLGWVRLTVEAASSGRVRVRGDEDEVGSGRKMFVFRLNIKCSFKARAPATYMYHDSRVKKKR